MSEQKPSRWDKDQRLGIPPLGVGEAVERLAAVMARLRAQDGCPWDRSMDHQSLRMYLLEETYEVLKALDDGDIQELKTELGDLLLQVVFHARIAEERGEFTLTDVANGIVEKLLSRHPHVFGDAVAHTPSQGIANWEATKRKEGKRLLEGVPRELPALLRAYRVQEKAANVGFDWELPDDAYQKLKEELEELYQASLVAFPHSTKPSLSRTDDKKDNEGDNQSGPPLDPASKPPEGEDKFFYPGGTSENPSEGSTTHPPSSGGAKGGVDPKTNWEEELGDVLFSIVNLARKHGVDPESALRKTIDKFHTRFAYIEDRLREQGKSLYQATLEEMDQLWEEGKILFKFK
ncbi:MAG: nucleoside triphosphate pyrophosphohydrolase [bacterium]|nr:nucleoside triphosphate pyrophosphohydrolase [bacterium]